MTTTIYDNQGIAFRDLLGNTATILPNIGFTISTPLKTLTANVNGFTNGTQTLLFTDLYAGVEKTKAIKFNTSTLTKLSVKNIVEIIDDDTTPTRVNTITDTSINITQEGVSNKIEIVNNASLDEPYIKIRNSDNTTISTLNGTSVTFSTGTNTNTLDAAKWTGNIQTVNTAANLTHYLNFSDSSSTGYGKPQKTAGISCNPSTNTITATTFSGSLNGNSSSASSISLTSDDTPGSYFLPFSKNVASNSALFVDNTTTPLTYNPNTSTLATSIINSSKITNTNSIEIAPTTDLIFSSNLKSGTSGGNSGQHLRIKIGSTYYKIPLQNDTNNNTDNDTDTDTDEDTSIVIGLASESVTI